MDDRGADDADAADGDPLQAGGPGGRSAAAGEEAFDVPEARAWSQ